MTRRGIRRAGSFRRGKGEWRSVVGVGETHGGRLEHGALDGSLRALDDGVVPREVRVSREERVGVGVGEDRAERLEARRRVGGESFDGLRERAGSRPRGGDTTRAMRSVFGPAGASVGTAEVAGGAGEAPSASDVVAGFFFFGGMFARRRSRRRSLAAATRLRARYWRPFAGRVVEVDATSCARVSRLRW